MHLVKKILLYSSIIVATISPQTPPLTIIFVIDQFAHHYLHKIKPFLHNGLHFLLTNGVRYENAYYPHAVPETGPGHTTLSTGTFPKDHGIIANAWLNQEQKMVECDDDIAEKAAVFAQENQLHSYGKSSATIMVDGLSDQFVLQSQPHNEHLAFAISLKSRAAIGTATKLGKAIWFDKDTGLFTSSKAYFSQLPAWVTTFNTTINHAAINATKWHLRYPASSKAYGFKQIDNYKYSSQKSLITVVAHDHSHHGDYSPTYSKIYQSPIGDRLTLALAKKCINTHLKPNNHLLVWISLSCLDYIGHIYGPDSLEAIDLLYHLDKELGKFIHFVQNKVGKPNVLFALTADHGVLPMQGILKEEGITAKRIFYEKFIKEMNELIQQQYNVSNFVLTYAAPQFYINAQQKKSLKPAVYTNMVTTLKEYLRKKQGIRNVWTNKELDTALYFPNQLEYYFKNQRYPGRSGDLFVELQPFYLLTKYKEGTAHESPYNYDTHVPLILYKKGSLESKAIVEKVFMTQFAPTMAQILGIPRPSASVAKLLPEIFDRKKKHEQLTELKKLEVSQQ